MKSQLRTFLKLGTQLGAYYLTRGLNEAVYNNFEVKVGGTQESGMLTPLLLIGAAVSEGMDKMWISAKFPTASCAAVVCSGITTGSNWDYFKMCMSLNTCANAIDFVSGNFTRAIAMEAYDLATAGAMAFAFEAEDILLDVVLGGAQVDQANDSL